MAEILVKCPQCGRKKAYISTTKRVGCCHSGRCGQRPIYREEAEELLAGRTPTVVESQPLRVSAPKLTSAWDNPDARTYLLRRHADPESGWPIMYDREIRRLYFRIWSPDPTFPDSWHTRGIDEGTTWRIASGTKKPHYLYGRPHPSGRAVLVEGIFDAIRLGLGGIAILGSEMSTTQAVYLTGHVKLITVWFDPDEAGEKATRQAMRFLDGRPFPISGRDPSPPEPSDCSSDHPVLVMVKKWLEVGEWRQAS